MKIKISEIKEIIIFSMLATYFSLGTIFYFSWVIGWFLLVTSSIYLLINYVFQLQNKIIIYDKFFFVLGIFIFILYEPFIYLLQGLNFPLVKSVQGINISTNNYETNFDIYVANKTGLICSIYMLFFYFGRMLVSNILNSSAIDHSKNISINGAWLFVYFLLALSPFFFSGTDSVINNFLINLAGRSAGNIGFSVTAAGSTNFIIILLSASILPTVVLMIIFIINKNIFIKFVGLLLTIFLFILYASLGGRSGIIMIFLIILVFWHIKSKQKIPILKISAILISILIILTIQINYRTYGLSNDLKIDSDESLSALEGYGLNRELAFIASYYGESEPFIVSNNFFLSSFLPLSDTVILFITNPIPRVVWTNKPIDPSFAEYNSLRTGLTGLEGTSNVTPTIPGRYYMKYGMLGVIQVGILMGVLWNIANSYISRYQKSNSLNILIPIFLLSLLFVSIRDFTAGRFYPFLFIVLFFYLNRIKLKRIK